jgi:hypothetical protein
VDNGPKIPALLDRLLELREQRGERFVPIIARSPEPALARHAPVALALVPCSWTEFSLLIHVDQLWSLSLLYEIFVFKPTGSQTRAWDNSAKFLRGSICLHMLTWTGIKYPRKCGV